MLNPKLEVTIYRRNSTTKQYDTTGRVLTDVYDADARLGIETIKDTFSFRTNNVLFNGSWNNPVLKKTTAANTIKIGDLIKLKAWNGTKSSNDIDDVIIYGQVTDFGVSVGDQGEVLSIDGANTTENLLNGFALGTYSITDSENNIRDIILNIFQQRLNYGPITPEKKVYVATTNSYLYDHSKGITAATAPTGITGSFGNLANTKSDGTAFKEITYTKQWQPVYRILEDLATTANTGDSDAGTYLFYVKLTPVLPEWVSVMGTNYIYELVFKPASKTLSRTLVRGTDYSTVDIKKDKDDVVNALIVKPGVDCNGVGITTYAANTESIGEVGPKFGYWGKPEIGNIVRSNERQAGSAIGSTFTGDYPDAVTAGSTWTFKTIFSRSSSPPYTEDKSTPKSASSRADYNNVIRNEIKLRGRIEADEVVKTLGEPRFSVVVDLLTGSNYINLGELVGIRETTSGWDGTSANPDYKLRVHDVRHKWTQGWTTQIVLKEDEKVISDRINT